MRNPKKQRSAKLTQRQRMFKRVQALQREHARVGHNCDSCRVYERVLQALEKP